MVLGGQVCGRWLGHGGIEPSWIGLRPLKKRSQRSLSTLFMWGQWEDLLGIRSGPSPETESVSSNLILDFLSYRAVRNKLCCLSHLVYAALL